MRGVPAVTPRSVRPELPGPPLLGHLRKRLNQLSDANLRYTFGQ